MAVWTVQSRCLVRPFRRALTQAALAMAKYEVVMIRHGESVWNKENRFCGWFDADLSDVGQLLLTNIDLVEKFSHSLLKIQTVQRPLDWLERRTACGLLFFYSFLTFKLGLFLSFRCRGSETWRRSPEVLRFQVRSGPHICSPAGPKDSRDGAEGNRARRHPDPEDLAVERTTLRRSHRAKQGRDRC